MRRTRFRVSAIMLTTVAAVSVPSAQVPDPGPGSVTVTGPVRVIEADTLEVSIRGARVGVRIAGIRVPRGNTECGRQASAALRKMLSSGAFLDREVRLPPIDVNTGWLRVYRVTTPAGRPVAAELARAGLAIADAAAADAVDFPEIAAGQADAKSALRGCVWSGTTEPAQ